MKARLNAACVTLVLAGSAYSSTSEEANGGEPKMNPGVVASAQDSDASRSSSPTSVASTPGLSAAPSSSAIPRASTSPATPTDWLAEGSQSDDFPTAADHAFPSSPRVGPHPGYERVVIQYTGDVADSTWKTMWTSDPIDEKGERINVRDDVFLQVDAAGVRRPSDVTTLPPTLHPGSPAGLSTVKGVSVQYPFEGQRMVSVGLSAKNSYRIQVLKDPSRLVIGVKKG